MTLLSFCLMMQVLKTGQMIWYDNVALLE